MPASIMPTLPAIVSPRIGAGAQELSTSYTDDRGFALSGLTAASAALRGALFEATGRISPGPGSGTPASSTSRPLSATTIALMMSPGPGGPGQTQPLLLLGGPSVGPPGASTPTTRGSPGSIMGYLSSGMAAAGTGGGGAGGGGGVAQEAAQSAVALRAAAEGLVEALEAAVRAREAQNREMLTAVRDSAGPASASAPSLAPTTSGRPASARGLDRALALSASFRTRPPLASNPSASTATAAGEERLGWVRTLVRGTDGGQAYAAAAEERERERERERPTTGGDGGEGATAAPGPGRRGALPALRPSRREDVVLLQSWLAEMLNQVAAAGGARQQHAAAAAAAAGSALADTVRPSGGSVSFAFAGSSAAAVGLVPEPGIQAQQAGELADAALYVVGVAMEELRRQVAAECRERGELLGQLVEQQTGLVALKGALGAEARAAEASAQWAGLLGEREREREAERERAREVAQDAATAAAAEGASVSSIVAASSLAAQLVAAHHAVAAAERRYQLADAALGGEAGRRAAAEQQLEATRELLRRQEHEWLHHRAANQRLESEVQALRDKLEAATRTAVVAEATVEAAREQTRIGRDDVSQLESVLARMRQQYEGNEILVAAQRQQVRELEAALAALRDQHREQAVALGKVGKVTEKYEETAANLRADLTALQERAAELEADLFARTARLFEVEERLATSDSELAAVRSRLSTTEAEAGKAAAEAESVQRQMRHEITDAVAARRQEETRRVEVEKETTAMVEMVKMLGRTMQLQGSDGVPGINDRSWESTGPLGAAQRVLGLATQQLASLFGSREDLTRELRTMQVKMVEEKEVNAKLQRDLYDARTTETRMLREKEVVAMKVSTLEHDLRVVQSEATKSRAAAQDGELRIKVQHETIVALQAQAKELVPLKKRVEALLSDMDCGRRMEEDLRNNLEVARQGLEQAEDQSRFYQTEVHKLQNEVGCLQDDVKALRVKETKLAEVEAMNKELEKQLLSLKHQLDLTAESHTDTIRQLELAKFFLQGLDSNVPASPARSSVSNQSPSRELRVAQSPHSRSPSRTITMSYNASQSGRFGSPPGRLFRGGGAALGDSGAFDADGRPISAVSSRGPRGGSFNRPGSAISGPVPEDEEYEDADNMDTENDQVGDVSEGGGAADGAAAAAAAGGGGGGDVGGAKSRGASAASRRGGGSAVAGGAGGGARSSRPASRLGSALGLSVDTRPMSGFGARSAMGADDDTDDYATEVSTVVMDIIESRGLVKRIHRSTNKWGAIKIGIMAWFSKRLRERLLEVSEKLAAKDLEIAQLHYSYVNEMRQREEFILTELIPTLMPVVESGLKDSQREVQQLRAQVPAARRDLDALAGACAVLGFSLQAYRDRETHAVCVSCQTDNETPDEWARFANHLPPLPPRLVLSLPSLVDTIVRVYVRASGTVEEVPTWGPPRHDTIHDAIMAHYTSQRAPGTFKLDLLQDPESPIARLLASALTQARNTKVASFLYFLNLSPEGVHWPSPTWHFFLHVLHCLRVLLSGTWRIVTKRWATPEGVQIPMPAALDLVGNLFNVQSPGDLDGALSVRLAAIVTPGVAGPAVDLDALLLLLVREYNAGNCPRAALLFPRRLTDGQLFNIFNSAGHNTHVSALKSALAGQYIGPAAPSSPTGGGLKRATSPGRPPGTGAPPQALAPAAAAIAAAAAEAAAAFGASLLTSTGDIMHPYGDMGEARTGNSFTALLDQQRHEAQLHTNMPDLAPPREAAGDGGGDGDSGGEGGGEGDGGDAAAAEPGAPRQGVRWGPPVPLTGPAPTQQQYPGGSMTVNFQISHEQHSAAVVAQAQQAQAAGAGAGGGGGGGGGVWAGPGSYYGEGGNRLTALPPPPPRPRKY